MELSSKGHVYVGVSGFERRISFIIISSGFVEICGNQSEGWTWMSLSNLGWEFSLSAFLFIERNVWLLSPCLQLTHLSVFPPCLRFIRLSVFSPRISVFPPVCSSLVSLFSLPVSLTRLSVCHSPLASHLAVIRVAMFSEPQNKRCKSEKSCAG